MGDGDEHPMYSEIKNEQGQPILRLMHPAGGVCEVYLFGATVTKFTTDKGRDLIWLSSTAKLDGTKAIRGGIPLVFPHFGQPIKEMAQHGFARNTTWKIKEYPHNKSEGQVTSDSLWVECTLSLDNTMATHEAWPHPYELQLIVKLYRSQLITELVVTNTGDAPFRFQSLQHTYLEVEDIAGTKVYGLGGGRFMDKTSPDPSERSVDARSAAKVGEFTDRVYTNLAGGGAVVVGAPRGDIEVSGRGRLTVPGTCEGLGSTCDFVVWNPWAEKAAGMADFDDEGYKRMLCIEPGFVSEFHVLPPKASFALEQTLKASE